MRALQLLSIVDWLALSVFLACWTGYTWFSEHSRWACKGLIGSGHGYRIEWAYRLLERDIRVTDSTLIGNLVTSVSFYANTTIYIIAGLVAALGAADQLLGLTADLPFSALGNKELLEIKLMLVLGSALSSPISNSPGRCASSTCCPSWSAPHRKAPPGRRKSTATPAAWRRQQSGRRRFQPRHPRLLFRPGGRPSGCSIRPCWGCFR
jgi:hypothetical protein